jgi:hypothetical protein
VIVSIRSEEGLGITYFFFVAAASAAGVGITRSGGRPTIDVNGSGRTEVSSSEVLDNELASTESIAVTDEDDDDEGDNEGNCNNGKGDDGTDRSSVNINGSRASSSYCWLSVCSFSILGKNNHDSSISPYSLQQNEQH